MNDYFRKGVVLCALSRENSKAPEITSLPVLKKLLSKTPSLQIDNEHHTSTVSSLRHLSNNPPHFCQCSCQCYSNKASLSYGAFHPTWLKLDEVAAAVLLNSREICVPIQPLSEHEGLCNDYQNVGGRGAHKQASHSKILRSVPLPTKKSLALTPS